MDRGTVGSWGADFFFESLGVAAAGLARAKAEPCWWVRLLNATHVGPWYHVFGYLGTQGGNAPTDGQHRERNNEVNISSAC